MRKIAFFILLLSLSTFSWAQTHTGNPCAVGGILPFCTEQNDFNMASPAITNQNDDDGAHIWLQSHNVTTCLSSQPRGSWYLFQIAHSGDLLIEIVQRAQVLPNGQPNMSSTGYDVDFACWGPFDAFDQDEFKQNLCNGTYTLSSGPTASAGGNHCVQNHSNGNTGGYPIGNLVDCSYDPSHTEWCFIPNAQTGQFYLLLVTNFNGATCYLGFSPQTITGASDPNATVRGSTNCDLLNCLETNEMYPCEGNDFILYCNQNRQTLPSNVQYRWKDPSGNVLATTVDSFLVVNAVNTEMSGQYELVLVNTYPEQHGFVNVTVQVTPTPIIASETVICKGDSITLSTPYNIFYTGAYEGHLRWFYQNMDGNPISTDTSVVVFPTEDCQYILKVRNGQTGCNKSDTISITVNPIPDLNISAEKTALCYGESTHITASCPAGQNVTYQWSNHNANASINVSPNETTTYTVTAKLVDGAQCEKDTSIVINVDKEIHLSSDVTPSHCEQAIGEIVMHATGGDGNFHFNAHQSTAVFIDSVASNLKPGSYVVTATDGMACTQSTTIQVPSIPGPDACFIFNSSDNVNMVVTNCTQGNNNNYYWDFGDMTTSTETHPTHEYMEPGRYTVRLEVVDNFNCLDSLSQDYVINGPVYIATAFTPNGDGINDEIMVIGKAIQEVDFLWVIYDRHGSLVFMSNSPHLSWDGTLSNGKAAMPGVYTYHLKYKDISGNHFERDGNITLIR